jgi:A/G-specific adenine glycosylase
VLAPVKKAKAETKSSKHKSASAEIPLHFSPPEFRRLLNAWYRRHARRLPWRGVEDPYATWLSEIMLQQTRVATVIDRYREFMQRFPTLRTLATAKESEVLALWSGLGYYRRARMLLRGAQFVERELHGKLPQTVAELRTLPGVGVYTAAAIASIAFGECVAVVDGNVERVLLRVLGLPERRSAAASTGLMRAAQALMPRTKHGGKNPQGDHNQAMMELGATICLPRAPLCLQCPVFGLCRTRGQHDTPPRTPQRSRTVAHLLMVRKRGTITEVLLEHRAEDASLMPGMLELPVLPLEAVVNREPVLRVRHSITNTNFHVQIYDEKSLLNEVSAAKKQLEWAQATRLKELPLTGLARKVLQRLRVMPKAQVESL